MRKRANLVFGSILTSTIVFAGCGGDGGGGGKAGRGGSTGVSGSTGSAGTTGSAVSTGFDGIATLAMWAGNAWLVENQGDHFWNPTGPNGPTATKPFRLVETPLAP